MTSDDLLRAIDELRRRADVSKARLARLVDMDPASVRRLLSGAGHNPQVSTIEALAGALGHGLQLARKPDAERVAAEEERTATAGAAALLRSTPGGPFSTVLADPPWRFKNRTGKVAPEHRRLSRYDTMTVAQICALPVSELLAETAHLYLWAPNALIAEGLQVMEAWGFTYKSNLIWAKRRKDGGPDGRGVGFYFRNTTELILFGVKGSMRTLPPGRRQVNIIETRKREHSRKPDALYDVVEACSPGPYLEMFARHPRRGWSVFGDESAEDATPRGSLSPMYRGGKIATSAQLPLSEEGG